MQLLLSLIKANYWYSDALMNGLATYGVPNLSRAQSFVVTEILAGEHRASSIAKKLGVSRQAISQILMELVRREIVQVSKDPENARALVVELTPEFQQKGELCAQIYLEIQDELARRIGHARVDQLKSTLELDWGNVPEFSDDHHALQRAGAVRVAPEQGGDPVKPSSGRKPPNKQVALTAERDRTGTTERNPVRASIGNSHKVSTGTERTRSRSRLSRASK